MKRTFTKLFKNTIFMVLSLVFAFTFSNIVRADETITANDYKKAPAIANNQTVKSSFSNGDYGEFWYKIYVPTKCSINLEIKHELPVNYYLYNADLSSCIADEDWDWSGSKNDPATDSFNVDIPSKGYYYFKICNKSWKQDDRIGKLSIKYSIKLCPENFRVDYYGTDKLKLVWDPTCIYDNNNNPIHEYASGYEIQQKIKGKWKTIKKSNKNAYTVKKLAASTDVSFRIRAYISSGNTKYYGEWNTLNTTTAVEKVKITSVKNGKGAFKVNWKRVNCVGYEVVFSNYKQDLPHSSSNLLISPTTVKGKTKTSKTFRGLSRKQTYYIQVRAYKYITVNGQKSKLYGPFSSIKAVKTK